MKIDLAGPATLSFLILIFIGSSGCVSPSDLQKCGTEYYNQSTQSCCEEVVYNSTTWRACDGACYDSHTDTCCNDIVYSGTEWMNCGNMCYNRNYGVCKEGVLVAHVPVTIQYSTNTAIGQPTQAPSPKPTLAKNLNRLFGDTCVLIRFGEHVFCDNNPPVPGENERIFYDNEGNYYSTTIGPDGKESEYRLIAPARSQREAALEEIARRCDASPGCRWSGYHCICSYPDGSFTMISYV